MVKTQALTRQFSVVIAVLAIGCQGDSVRDFFGATAEKTDEGSVTMSTESATAETEKSLTDEAMPRALPNFDSSDGSAPPSASPPATPRDLRSDGQPPLDVDSPILPAASESPGKADGGSNQPVIRLQSAVVLPQSLPTGTAMGFSVDYQVSGTVHSSQVQYIWVIESPSGQSWESIVELQQDGNLQTFVTQWGPVRGAYEMRIDRVTGSHRTPASKPISAEYH